MKSAKQNASALQFSTIMKASFVFEAAIHPMRQQLLALLTDEPKMPVKTISALLSIEEEVCIQQLSILCGAGLLIRQQEKGEIFYLPDSEKLQQLYDCADALLEE